MTWPEHPRVLEINAWTWLQALSQKHRRPITLRNIPPSDLERETRHFDAVWLMGVWERSPRGREMALQHPELQEEYRRALPDFQAKDVVGSPYSIRGYRIDPRLGGPSGLATARAQLAQRGLHLILDFVPNHVAVDHDWTTTSPSCLIQGTKEDLSSHPELFFVVGDHVYAFGRDPNFPPWTDTAQVNAFAPEARVALSGTLLEIADQCDGLRCDMAMLVCNQIFERTWGIGPAPATEFWEEMIGAVKERFPDFKFFAEVYWDMEWLLQKQGFDFCYDKRLYDRLAHGNASEVRAHISADLEYQRRLIRFIENHDEARAPVVFGEERARAAAILALTLPGAKLVHEGQTRGHRIQVPVQLGRCPHEVEDPATVEFYHRLLETTASSKFHQGTWRLCHISEESSAKSRATLIAYVWEVEGGHRLIVVNFGEEPVRENIRFAKPLLQGRRKLRDLLTGRTYHDRENEFDTDGFKVELSPWRGHILEILRAE
jgi:glycosidase